jgi:hypothetical protein
MEQGAAFRGSTRNRGSEGPGPRPAGITTCLRGARCTDREGMPEKEARPPAQNRRGGAPRGAHARSQGRAKAPRKRLRRVRSTPWVPRKHPRRLGAPLPSFGEQMRANPGRDRVAETEKLARCLKSSNGICRVGRFAPPRRASGHGSPDMRARGSWPRHPREAA